MYQNNELLNELIKKDIQNKIKEEKEKFIKNVWSEKKDEILIQKEKRLGIKKAFNLAGNPFSKSFSIANKLSKFFDKSSAKTNIYYSDKFKKQSLLKKYYKLGLSLGLASFVGYVTLTTPVQSNFTLIDFCHSFQNNFLQIGSNICNTLVHPVSKISNLLGFTHDASLNTTSFAHFLPVDQLEKTSLTDILKNNNGILPHDIFHQILHISPKNMVNINGTYNYEVNAQKLLELGKYLGIEYGKTPSLESLNQARHIMTESDFNEWSNFVNLSKKGFTLNY